MNCARSFVVNSLVVYAKRLSIIFFFSGSLAEFDYIYDEESQDEEELTHVPTFTSVPNNVDVKIGDSITLPCLMDKGECRQITKLSGQGNMPGVFTAGFFMQ